jgi:hypothetical protein
MSSPRITYTRRSDNAQEAEQSVLAACYRIILDSQSKRDRLPDKSGPHDALLRNTKGGSYVDQRPG